MAVVSFHGAGRAGMDDWPRQAAMDEQDRAGGGWEFLSRAEGGDHAHRDAERILARLRTGGGGHVAAHPYGGDAALLAAEQEPGLVRSLVLFEPACLDLARGAPAVEEHVAAMTPVFDVADDPTVSAREFSTRFAAATGSEAPALSGADLEVVVARLRALRPPWGTGLTAGRQLRVPTLVVTSGWSELYEEVAQGLVALGARHAVLPGRGHRVQDHPDAGRLPGAFLVEHEARGQDGGYLAHYVAGWPRDGDVGVTAVNGKQPVGAAWARSFPQDDPGYGFVDVATPEVSMGVERAWRGLGIGTRLLDALIAAAREQGQASLSLSVEPDNYARRLYERGLPAGRRGQRLPDHAAATSAPELTLASGTATDRDDRLPAR